MNGHSEGYPWDNQGKDYSYIEEAERRDRRDFIKYILDNFGEVRDLSLIPKNTTFIGVDYEELTNSLAIVNIEGEDILFKETWLNKNYDETKSDLYKYFIFITDNEKGLAKSHWFRSVPVCKSANFVRKIFKCTNGATLDLSNIENFDCSPIIKSDLDSERHCSYCKFYSCTHSKYMYCSKLKHRIYASRKNGCKFFELNKIKY